MTCVAQGQALNYGNGLLILHTDAIAPNDPTNYDVLDCQSYQTPPGTPSPPDGSPPTDSPARILCGDSCKGCSSGDCPPPTYPPGVPPNANMKLRVRKGGIPGPTKMTMPGGLGPVQHIPFVPNMPFSTVLELLTASVEQQPLPKAFHLYVTVDTGSAPLHAFHNKLIAIPVGS